MAPENPYEDDDFSDQEYEDDVVASPDHCPDCDIPGSAVPGAADLLVCRNCGQYFDLGEEEDEGLFDQSSHHRTKMPRLRDPD